MGGDAVNIGMIEASARRLDGHARVTPLLSSPFVDEIAGRRVLVKAEALQHTGSFKYRGAWSAISALSDNALKTGVIAYSSGNHAQGIALAAKQHGIPAVIVMPADAPEVKIANTRTLGAEVVLYDRPGGEDRRVVGGRIARERGLTLVNPYDDSQVIAGQGSVGLEIAEQAADEGVSEGDVLVCCGGGGLSSGVALALEARAPGLRVRPVEPEMQDDVRQSLVAGRIVAHGKPEVGLCDAILTPAPGQITFPILHRLCGPGLAVSDAEVKTAMRIAFERLKLVLEPGGAVAFAAALFRPDQVGGDAVIAIATGGNVDMKAFARILAEG